MYLTFIRMSSFFTATLRWSVRYDFELHLRTIEPWLNYLTGWRTCNMASTCDLSFKNKQVIVVECMCLLDWVEDVQYGIHMWLVIQKWARFSSRMYVLQSSRISRKSGAMIMICSRKGMCFCILLFWESFNWYNFGTTGSIQVGFSAKCTSPIWTIQSNRKLKTLFMSPAYNRLTLVPPRVFW